MLRRSPLKPGSGFKRKVYEPPPAPIARRVERTGVYGGTTTAAAPKPVHLENARALRLARDQDCVLRIPGVCNFDSQTTVACHSNLAEHGKAGARKADDCYVVFGCAACHSWLDQGRASYEDKRAAFLDALQRQGSVWHAIAADPARPEADREAARWVLRHLLHVTG